MRDFASQNVALDRKVEELNFLLYVHYSDSYLRRCGDIIGGYYAVLVPGMFGGGGYYWRAFCERDLRDVYSGGGIINTQLYKLLVMYLLVSIY